MKRLYWLALLFSLAAHAQGTSFAVFTEFSPDSKPLKGGWNARVFTDTDVSQGDGIGRDPATGIITLAPGTYHLMGMSIVTYNSGGEPREMATVRAPASAGYCRLRLFDPNAKVDPTKMRGLENSDPSVICVGSLASANTGASLFDTYYTATRPVQLLLEHQAGNDPQQIYLRVFVENSRWHVMARIRIQRL